MKRNRFSRGSVLMEFIIVIPIYLVLFGGLFETGDMLLNSLRIPSSERTAAFDVAQSSDGWTAVRARLFPFPYDDGLPASPSSSSYYSDTQVRGPWTLRSATKVRYSYKAPAWTHGWLACTDSFFDNVFGDDELEGPIDDIIQGEKVAIYSKSWNTKMAYNYYTLKRRKWKRPNWTWRWRRRPPSDLVSPIWYESPWYEEVHGERWHETVVDGANTPNDPPPVGSLERYVRNPLLVEWSFY